MTETQPWESDEQREHWRQVCALEEAGRPREQARLQKLADAARAPGFAGELRTAVLDSRRHWEDLAAAIGVRPIEVYDWMSGDADLPAPAVARLVDALELHLTSVSR
jgi:hypothetical protein